MTNGHGPDLEAGLAPEAVEKADFDTVRRGYESEPVRRRLRAAADEIRRLNGLVESLSQRISELEAAPPELDAARALEAVGDEAARVLQAARDGAQQRLERAEADSDAITAEARSTAADIVEQGRDQGRELVVEARNFRERILTDLAYKRHAHRVEVEQLRVVHDRLLEALAIFREGLDGWISDVAKTGPQAKAAAERAGLLVAAEPEPTVAEMEADIEAGRRAGPDLGDEEDWPEGAVLRPEDDRQAGAQPDDSGGAEPGATAHSPGAEPSEIEELDELDETVGPQEGLDRPDDTSDFETSEYVEIVSYKSDPPEPSARASVGLYDVEAEPVFEPEAGPGVVPHHPSGAEARRPPTAGESPDAALQAPAADANAIFARLRSITSRPATGLSPGRKPQRRPAAGIGDGESLAAGPAEASEASEADDLVGAARAVAVGGISRRLKRLVVDEQGELLDAVRKGGSRALRSLIAAEAGPYARAAVEPLQDFASDIDVSIDDIDLQAASTAIVSVLVEPVRARLSEMSEETDDSDELARAVRSIYRESRSRRAEAAAEAAFSAGWPEPVS